MTINRKRFLGTSSILVFLAVAIIVIVFLINPDMPDNTSSSAESSSANSGGGSSEPDNSSPDTSSASSSVVIGDITGIPENPDDSDDPTSSGSSSQSSISSSSSVSEIEPDNSIGSQPQPDPMIIGGNDGFVDAPRYIRDSFNYDEFRYFPVVPSDFAQLLTNAREFIREPIMFDKARNPFANDYQQRVTQTGQYVFQHVGVTCTNPMDAFFVKYQGNPIAWGQNVYTPWIVKKGDTWFVYYGGWGDVDCVGNDTTYLMKTKDPDLRGPYTYHGKVMKAGGDYVHAQDASVALGPDGKFLMAYSQTTIHTGKGVDWIGIAQSDDGIHFTAYGNDKVGIADSVSSEMKITNYTRKESASTGYDNIGRPSLYYNAEYARTGGGKGRWEMYVDGENFDGKGRSNAAKIFLFTSEEDYPINWKYEGDIRQGGETALAVINGVYYLAYRDDSSWPTRMKVASSTDGKIFGEGKLVITGERTRDGSVNNITQMAFATENNTIKAIMYGRSLDGWQHKVSLAYPQKKVEIFRGSELVMSEALATSTTTQVISSGGIYTPVTKIRVYDRPGRPAIFESFIKLFSGQSVSLIKNDAAPARPVLRGPTQNETKVLWGPTFYWSPSFKASSFKLEVAEDNLFTDLVLIKNTVLVEQFTVREKLESGKKYYWRVTAQNSSGSTVSEIGIFTVLGDNEVRGELIQLLPDSVMATDDVDAGSKISNLSDGPYYTYWSSVFDEEALPSFTMDYGRQYPIAQFYWQPRTDYVGWPTEIRMEYSINGTDYFEIKESDCITTNNFSNFASDYRPKYISLKEPRNARFIRVTVLNNNYSPVAGMAEFRSLILR